MPYKIRDRNTGLFSSGGYNPRWTKNGKVWSTKGALHNHLTLTSGDYQFHGIPPNWEIVEYEVVVSEREARLACLYETFKDRILGDKYGRDIKDEAEFKKKIAYLVKVWKLNPDFITLYEYLGMDERDRLIYETDGGVSGLYLHWWQLWREKHQS